MTNSTLTIIYHGLPNKCPYPDVEMKIKDFINQLKDDLNVDNSVLLHLLHDSVRLLPSGTIRDYGIKAGDELKLEENTPQVPQNPVVTFNNIILQTFAGEQYEYKMHMNATLQDLFSAINANKNVSSTKTFSMLFNHRMHLWKSNELLTNYLKLHRSKSEFQGNVPDFYLLECQHQFETHYLDYQKAEHDDLFLINDFWQPLGCVKQSEMAISIYLISLKVLRNAFLSQSSLEVDTINHTRILKLLLVLRQFLFQPACLALYHVLEGQCFLFEKQLLSEAFYRLFREMLPLSVADSDVFLYTPHILYHLFESTQQSSTEYVCYKIVELARPTSTVSTVVNEPVEYLSKMEDGFILTDLASVQKNEGFNDNFVRQSDLIALLTWMKQQANTDSTEKYFKNYRIWIPTEQKSMVSIGNIFEQRVKVSRFDEQEIRLITDNLKRNDIYGQFTFLKPSTLETTNHAQFVLLNNKHVVYFNESEKSGLNYKCFDPLAIQSVSTFAATDIASEADLERYPYFPIRESLEDMPLIKQITVLLFDVSSSMKSMVGNHGSNKQSLLDLSVVALSVWCDKVISYRLSQALGLIHFGANGTKIVEKCSISKDLSKLESALSHSPQCGGSTPLYDAVEIAIQAIARFRMENAQSISTECRSLIVCFSDGEDNDSKSASFETVKSHMKDANIVFDTVSFLPYESSKLIQLCEATNGFYYINVPHDKNEMTKLFEREASLMICERGQISTVRVEMPEKRAPKRLHEPAKNIENVKINTNQMLNNSAGRVIRQLHDLKNTPLENFTVFLMNEDVLFWKVIMKGPDRTPYADYYWLLSAEFLSEYPFKAPEIRFITPIYHCNINNDGRICHEILDSKWTPATKLRTVFEEIQKLLIEPNPDNAVSTETSTQYRSDPKGYEKAIKRLKEEQAKKSISEIMKQYQLEEN